MPAFRLPSPTQRQFMVVPLAVACLAAALRLGLVLLSMGGPGGSFGYDASVYYAASDALLHGRFPYRDFLLLHPPGLIVALTPFAAVGRLIGDHAGFMLGNTCFALLGSVNAGLIVVLARRLGLTSRAGLVGGLFYAVWFGAVQSEFSARLEPLGSTLFLCGLLCTQGGPRSRRWLVLGGVLLGASVSVKVWWVAPVLLVLGVETWRHRRQAWPTVLGAVAAGVVISGPFFVAAPHQMLRMVAADQLGRPMSGYSRLHRLGDLVTVHQAFPSLDHVPLIVLLAVTAALVSMAGLAAWSSPLCRVAVALVVLQLTVLVLAPTYFAFYAGYLAVSLSVLVAGAAGSSTRWGRATGGCMLIGALALTGVAGFVRSPKITAPVPGAGRLAREVADVQCIVSDSPMVLIELNALSRGLSDPRCPNWVDVSGRTYDVDAPSNGRGEDRLHNTAWQADLRRYLLSGDAVVLFRGDTGVAKSTLADLRSHPVLAGAGRVTVYRVR